MEDQGLNPSFDYTNIEQDVNHDPSIGANDILEHTDKLITPDEITAADLLSRKIEEIPCLVHPVIQQVGLASLAGSSDVGKSAMLRQLAVSIVAGEKHFLGFPIRARHHSSIYVSTEDEQLAISYLLNRQNKGKGFMPDQLNGLRFVFDSHDLLNELERRLTAKPADLVIIDAFADLYGKSMNDSNQVRFFLNDYSQLAQKHQCLVMFLHHVGKRKEDEAPNKHNILGSQGYEAKMRLVIELRNDHMNPKQRHFCIVKGNYLPSEYKRESYVLRFDENMLFHNTDEREPFELLERMKEDASKAKYEKAKELREQGYTYEQIAKELKYKSKGSVAKLFKKYENVS